MSEYVNVCVKHPKGKTIVTFHGDDCPLCEAERVIEEVYQATKKDLPRHSMVIPAKLKIYGVIRSYREKYPTGRKDE